MSSGFNLLVIDCSPSLNWAEGGENIALKEATEPLYVSALSCADCIKNSIRW